MHVPEKKLYIFYGNYCFAEPNTPVKRILSRMLDMPYPKPIAVPGQSVNDYTGTFRVHHPGSRMDLQISDWPLYATFSGTGDSLFVRFTEREKQWIRPAGKDQFISRNGDLIYVFHRDEDGKVISVSLNPFMFGGAVNEKAKKMTMMPQPELKVVMVKPELLTKYAGTYYKTFGDDYFFLTTQDGKLFGFEMDIAQKFELLPVTQNKFVRKGIEDVSYTFTYNDKKILVLTISGNRTSDYGKVSDY